MELCVKTVQLLLLYLSHVHNCLVFPYMAHVLWSKLLWVLFIVSLSLASGLLPYMAVSG